MEESSMLPSNGVKLDAIMRPQFNIKAILVLTMLSALFLTAISSIPIDATILVPWQYGDLMETALNRHGIPATRDRAGNFNCQYFRSVEGRAYQIWLAETYLLDDATANGYYCEISYAPLLSIRNWRNSVGNDRMVGLQ